MPFNVKKCKVLHLGKRNSKTKYKLMGSYLSDTSEEKDLGVTFNDSFSPSINCSKVSKAAQGVIGMIRRNISNRSKEAMLILYKTLIRPHLDYCSQVWRPYLRKDVLLVERVQKRFTKMIDGCTKLKYENRLNKLKLTSMEDRHRRADMLQVYKVLHDRSGLFPKNFLKLNDRLGRTNSMKLYKQRVNKELRRNGFTSRTIDYWNALPEQVVRADSANVFKGEYDRLVGGVGRRT